MDRRRYMVTAHRDEKVHSWRGEKQIDRAEQHVIRWPLTHAEAAKLVAGFYADDETKSKYDFGWDDIEVIELQPALPDETDNQYFDRLQECRWEVEAAARDLARVAAEQAAAVQRVATEAAERAKLAELLARYGPPAHG